MQPTRPKPVNYREMMAARPKRERQGLYLCGGGEISNIASIASLKAGRSQRQSASNFAKNLIRTRKELGWSRADLASFTGVSLSSLGAIERGEVSPRLDVVMKLCVIMCVDVGDMVM